jgi:PAS domain S-box-containing protein
MSERGGSKREELARLLEQRPGPTSSWLALATLISLITLAVQFVFHEQVPSADFVLLYPSVFLVVWIFQHNRRIEQKSARLIIQLAEEEERFRSTFELAAMGIAHVSLEGRWLRVNDEVCRITGYSREELLNLGFAEITHPEDLEKDRLQARQLLTGEIRTYTMEKRYIRKTGGPIWVSLTVSLVRSSGGEPRYFIAVIEDIQADKETRDTLKATAERLELAVQYAGVGFYDWDVRRNHVVFSERMRSDWGLDGEDVSTLQAALERIHSDDRDRVSRLIYEALEKRTPYHTQYRVVRSDGTAIWLDVAGTVNYDDSGVPIRFFGTSIDITEKKRAEEIKERASEQLRIYAEAMPQMAFIADPTGNLVFYNQRHYDYFGVKQGETKGWSWKDFPILHPDDRDRTIERWTHSIHSGEPYEIEYRLRRHDGVYRWHLARAVPVRGAQSEILQWVGTNTDIDEQKKTSEQLDRLLREVEFEKSRFEAVMRQMPAAVIIGEAPSGKLVFSNDKMHQVWGHDLIKSRKIDEYAMWVGFHADGRRYEPHEWPLARSIEKGEVVTNEDIEILRETGGRGVLRLSSTPILDRDGKIVAGVVICQDVTELVDAIRSRDEFLSICSHELKTPLTSVSLATQTVKRSINKGDPQALAPERIKRLVDQTDLQVRRLARLVDDMLDISRIRAGRLSLDLKPLKLSQMISDIVERMTPILQGSTGVPEMDLDPSAMCLADSFRLEQVVVNLLTNAARYGSGKPVRIELRTKGDRVILSVRDHGIGISPENLERVFSRFERLVSANEVSGLGLGLFISRQIVESHHGRIWVESRLGVGSTFFVELPRFTESLRLSPTPEVVRRAGSHSPKEL